MLEKIKKIILDENEEGIEDGTKTNTVSIEVEVDVTSDDDIETRFDDYSQGDESKSAIDYLKEELKKRTAEKKELRANLQAERERLAAAREAAKERNIFRKLKIVDNAISKIEIERDEQALQEFEQAEQKKISIARSQRGKEIASKNKKPIAALLTGLIVAGCAAGGIANHSHNVALAAAYDEATAYIVAEEYDKAKDILIDLDIEDSDALYYYAYQQSSIEDYRGKPDKMLDEVSGIKGIQDEEVRQQQAKACEEIELADEIQDTINSLDLSSVDSISDEAVEKVGELKPSLDERYTLLLDTEKLDLAERVIQNVEANNEAGKIISDIDSIGEVSLDSKDIIDNLKKRYEKLSEEDKETILNYDILITAEKTYKDLKKKDDERIAAEKKAAEEKAAAEKKAAEEKAAAEKKAAEEKAEAERLAKEAEEEHESWLNEEVVITSGYAYHYDGCSYLRGSSNKQYMTRRQAINLGKQGCSRCHAGVES